MTAKIEVYQTDAAGKAGVILAVPPELLWQFKQVIERGMAFEFGQPQAMYDFTDRLQQIKSS